MARKPKKVKGPIRIPQSFTIFDTSWKVEHKWNLKDSAGRETPVIVNNIDNVITLDRSLAAEDKPSLFMKALLEAVFANSLNLNESTSALADELSDFLLDTFTLRWRKDA